MVVADLKIGGWQFSPLKDKTGQVIGTNLFFVQSADPGGNIPKALANKKAPSLVLETIKRLCKLLKARKQKLGLSGYFD